MSVDGSAVDDEAVAHVQDAMSVRGRFRIMRDHHDGLAQISIELAKEAENALGTFRVEIARGLVRENDFRLADNGAGKSDALLFAAGKLRGLVLQALAETKKIGDHVKAVRVEAISVNMLRERDIVIGVERGEQIESLEHEADFVAAKQGSGGVAHRREIISIEKHAAASGLRQTANHMQHGRFPAARRTHDGDELSRKDFDVDAA